MSTAECISRSAFQFLLRNQDLIFVIPADTGIQRLCVLAVKVSERFQAASPLPSQGRRVLSIDRIKFCNAISKSILPLSPSPCSAHALSSSRLRGIIDLEMEQLVTAFIGFPLEYLTAFPLNFNFTWASLKLCNLSKTNYLSI
jgi:hypothetical protein